MPLDRSLLLNSMALQGAVSLTFGLAFLGLWKGFHRPLAVRWAAGWLAYAVGISFAALSVGAGFGAAGSTVALALLALPLQIGVLLFRVGTDSLGDSVLRPRRYVTAIALLCAVFVAFRLIEVSGLVALPPTLAVYIVPRLVMGVGFAWAAWPLRAFVVPRWAEGVGLMAAALVALSLRMFASAGYELWQIAHGAASQPESTILTIAQVCLLMVFGMATALVLVEAERLEAVRAAQTILEGSVALRESEERFRRLASATFEGIIFLEAGRVIEVNEQAAAMFGYQREEMVGTMALGYVAPESRVAAEESARTGFEGTAEAWVLHRNGSRFRIEGRARQVTQGGRVTQMLALRDVTERERAAQMHARLEEQLRQAHKLEAIGRLAGGVAHDFNNMLSIILGHTELALDLVDPSGAVHDDLRQIQQAAQHSADLTGQLLAFARKQTSSPQVLDVDQAVNSMFKMLQRLIGEDVTLTWTPDGQVWPVRMDPAQLQQILTNLTLNARDAIDGVGTVSITAVNTTLDAAACAAYANVEPGPFVLLSVSDTGRGMPAQILEHIFEPFFTTKGIGEGTGLGLATVFGIVRQNDGVITVRSTPGAGTSFSIYLPRARRSAPEAVAEPLPRVPQGAGEVVLLVEDEPGLLRIGQILLRRLGYTVLAAPTPHEAIRIAESHAGDIQLLVTDVILPEMNGRQLCERISTLRPGVKCLFVSGYPADVIAHRGLPEEGVLFLQKPFTLEALAVKVREALAGSPASTLWRAPL